MVRFHRAGGNFPSSSDEPPPAGLWAAIRRRDRACDDGRFAIAVVLAGFVVLAAPRVNHLLLLEPDSSDYVIMALSLAHGEG